MSHHSVIPLTILHLIGDLHCVLRCLADQGVVVCHKQHGSLDVRRLELQHVIEKIHAPGVANDPRPLLEWLSLDVVKGKKSLRLEHLVMLGYW